MHWSSFSSCLKNLGGNTNNNRVEKENYHQWSDITLIARKFLRITIDTNGCICMRIGIMLRFQLRLISLILNGWVNERKNGERKELMEKLVAFKESLWIKTRSIKFPPFLQFSRYNFALSFHSWLHENNVDPILLKMIILRSYE